MTVRAHSRASYLVRVSAVASAAVWIQSCTLDMAGTRGGANPAPQPVDASGPAQPSEDGAVDAEAGASNGGDAQTIDAARDDGSTVPPPAGDAGADQDGAADAPSTDAARDATEPDGGGDGPVDSGQPVDDAGATASDAGSNDTADAAIESDASAPPPGCDIAGTYALQVDYDVNWRGTSLAGLIPLLRPGEGRVRIWAAMEVRENGRRARGHGCGVELPDFAAGNPAAGREVYGAYIPEATWDVPVMPRMDMTLTAECLNAGCSVSSTPLVATLGARVGPNNPWPGPNGSLDSLDMVDHDQDGLPGLTLYTYTANIRTRSGGTYAQPPLSWTLTPRATRLFMALQVEFQLAGKLSSCDEMGGGLTRGRVENRIESCYARASSGGPETPCTDDQARFGDQNLPEWSVRAAAFRARRVQAGATCEAVRDAFR